MNSTKTVLAAVGISILSGTVATAEPVSKIKLGLVTTFTTSAGEGGEATKRGVELALDVLGQKIGDIPVELLVEDDGLRPELGKQKTDKLILQDNVDFLLGYNYSNVLLASFPSAVENQTFILSTNAGPHQLAGSLCNPWTFAVGFQNGQAPGAMGIVMNEADVKRVYAMAPNYTAGKDMIEGMKSTFNGEVVGTSLTKWPDQLDFSGELANVRAANPDAVYIFYPPAHALQFVTQYQQAGLYHKIPLYSVYTFDALTIPTIGELAEGALFTMFWATDLDNEPNKTFVQRFVEKYGREPSNFAASAYDTVMLIDSAVRKVGGELSDKEALRKALEAAEFASVRGNFRFGPNHFPIQDFYLVEVVKGADGKMTTRTVRQVVADSQDAYASECSMK
ncbi:MAG: ABC transporter substrate-binding protein [Rhizobiaceae bacterium]